MSDGTVLLADHWLPDDPTPAPLLLVRSPYGRRGLFGVLYGRLFAHQGFQVVIQSCRGTAGSGGTFDRPFVAEARDGTDTVDWLVKQPWYPGCFNTIGASYLGYVQLAAAQAARGHLRSAVLQIAPVSPRSIAWPDGAFALNTALGWASQAHRDPAAQLHNMLTQRKLTKRVTEAGREAPLAGSYTKASGSRVPFFEGWLSHPRADDPWWEDTDHKAALDVLDCPVLIQSGWYDTFLEDSLEQFHALRRRRVDAELTVGPWTHLTFSTKGGGRTLSDAVAFLRDVNGLEPRSSAPAPVRLTEIGTGRELQLSRWPQESATKVLHLAGNGKLTDASYLGSHTTSFRYDPADPTPSVGGTTIDLLAGPHDNTSLEARSDVRAFTSPPLGEDLCVLGPVAVDLWFGSDRPATALFLRLCHVDSEGVSTNVTDRLVVLRGEARTAVGTWRVSVELPPTCLRVAKGTRIRLQVSSGAFPRYARHPGTEEPLGTAERYEVANQTIHHSAALPSTVTLPLASPA